MKLGSAVFAGSARLCGEVCGIFEHTVAVRLDQTGTRRMFPKHAVIPRRRPAKFAVGEQVLVVIDETACRGEVVCYRPLRARITDKHPIWAGAVVSDGEARICKEVAGE